MKVIKVIDRAISFYDESPDGVYDELAVLGLQFCRELLYGTSNATEVDNKIEELKIVMSKEISDRY